MAPTSNVRKKIYYESKSQHRLIYSLFHGRRLGSKCLKITFHNRQQGMKTTMIFSYSTTTTS